MAKESYLVSSLPFDNSVTYDECGLNYTTVGNPVIVDTSSFLDVNGNKPFKKALYLNGSSYIKSIGTIPFAGADLTVECWFYFNSHTTSTAECLFKIGVSDSNRIACFYYGNTSIMTSTKGSFDQFFTIVTDRWNHIAYCYVHNKSMWYTYVNGKLMTTVSANKNRANMKISLGNDLDFLNRFVKVYIKYFKIYDYLAKWTTSSFNLKETYETPVIQYTTKRNIYHLYNILYDSLYKYNINDSLLYNDISRNIHNKILYNNDTLRNVLYNINSLYNTYRYIKRINKYNNITKRNIINNINILYNTKKLIHNNINIINYIYRKRICNNNINNDTVRSVISWKHKIITFVTNPRYKLR